MKNSLVTKYFAICFSAVVGSILILGLALLYSSSQFFKVEKYELLEQNASQAAVITANNYETNAYNFIDERIVTLAYSVLSNSINADFILTDLSGRVLLGVKPGQERIQPHERVPLAMIENVVQHGVLEEMGTIEGFHGSLQYIVGVPVKVSGDTTVAVLFVSSSAAALGVFLQDIMTTFAICAVIVLLIAFVLLYFITAQPMRPLKDMLFAMQSFSKGDFSVRVPVSGTDEIGQLAMSVNNMASSVASLESSRRAFIANVSHELKTPMTTIGGFVDGILDGTIPEEKWNQYLQIVSVEVQRLSRLVRSMLDTARIEAGEQKLNLTTFDISETVRQSVFSFEQAIEQKQVEILGLEKDKVLIDADVDLMHQVIYNLVDNAVKFVNEGGYIKFDYRAEDNMTYISVRNSGAGIAKEDIPRLFERFYKSDKSRSLNKAGAGLGLHIVKSIVNYHNGEIMVRSVAGEYTEFQISLPNLKNSNPVND